MEKSTFGSNPLFAAFRNSTETRLMSFTATVVSRGDILFAVAVEITDRREEGIGDGGINFRLESVIGRISEQDLNAVIPMP